MNDAELLRYSRHIFLNEIDVAGQEILANAHVLVIGCGGLGSAALPYLAASGIGNLTIIDDDCIDLSNLQRQISYREQDIGKNKAQTMQHHLQALNSLIHITAYTNRLNSTQLIELAKQADAILDCSDNFETRHQINQVCVQTKTPLISAAAIRFTGQLYFMNPNIEECPCYTCLFGNEPFTDGQCSQLGIFSPIVGIIGTTQAALTLRYLLNIGDTHPGILHQYDGLSGKWQLFHANKQLNCPTCGQK